MKYVSLGKTGVQVSELCFGTMSFGGDADRETSAQMYRSCRERGINFFDCADVYGAGLAEETLGALLEGHRDEIVLASKAHGSMGAAKTARGSNRFHLVRAVEASLRRLKTDRLDILYLHHYDVHTDLEDTLRSLELLLLQGKILYPAASNFAAWQVMKALNLSSRHGWAPLACLQPMYNLAKRQAEVEILPMALDMGVGICSYSPLGGGLLTGKYIKGQRAGAGRLTSNAMYARRYAGDSYHQTAEKFVRTCEELGLHPASTAVAWVASHPAITCPIIGARNLEQLKPSLDSVDVPMTPELRARLGALSPAPAPAHDRNDEPASQ